MEKIIKGNYGPVKYTAKLKFDDGKWDVMVRKTSIEGGYEDSEVIPYFIGKSLSEPMLLDLVKNNEKRSLFIAPSCWEEDIYCRIDDDELSDIIVRDITKNIAETIMTEATSNRVEVPYPNRECKEEKKMTLEPKTFEMQIKDDETLYRVFVTLNPKSVEKILEELNDEASMHSLHKINFFDRMEIRVTWGYEDGYNSSWNMTKTLNGVRTNLSPLIFQYLEKIGIRVDKENPIRTSLANEIAQVEEDYKLHFHKDEETESKECEEDEKAKAKADALKEYNRYKIFKGLDDLGELYDELIEASVSVYRLDYLIENQKKEIESRARDIGLYTILFLNDPSKDALHQLQVKKQDAEKHVEDLKHRINAQYDFIKKTVR